MNKRSKETTPIFFCRPENFVNIKNEHPNMEDVIDPKDVVFDKNELKDNKWFFCLNDESIIEKAKKSIRHYMLPHDLNIVIQPLPKIKEEKREFKRMEMEIRPLYIKEKYKSLKEFEEKYGEDVKDGGIGLMRDIKDAYRENDEIWHHDDFGIAPRLCEREAILLIRDGYVASAFLVKIS